MLAHVNILIEVRKFIKRHKDILTVVLLVFFWRIYFIIVQMNASRISIREGYLGFLQTANFDGVFYLYIAQFGYHGLDQAFFPLFPITINAFIRMGFAPISAAILVVTGSLLGFLYVLTKLVKIDYKGNIHIWVILFFLSFPTSFFLGSIYTESFFLFLTISSFYFARKKKILLASIIGGFSSGTRIIGIFILPALFFEVYEQQKNAKKIDIKQYLSLIFIPAGLLSYMLFLWLKYGDPLLFVHQQPSFGAGRSGGDIIFLPQVIYRYIKIFITIPPTNLAFLISTLEFITLVLVSGLLILAYKKGIRKSYILFSVCALIFPTLSGTLSSLPRYVLGSFAFFIYLGLLKNKYMKIILILLGLLIEGIFAILFLQGYFIA